MMYFAPGPAGFGAAVTRTLWALIAAVLLKSFLYARFAGYGMARGALDMTIGNILSTIPGVLIIAIASTPPSTITGLTIIGLVMAIVIGRLLRKDLGTAYPYFSGIKISFALCVLLFLSFLACVGIESMDRWEIITSARSAAIYWAVKIAMVFAGLCSTLIISVVFEACVIFRARREKPEFNAPKLLDAILKANLAALFAGALAGALYTLPHRIQSPGFLFFGD